LGVEGSAAEHRGEREQNEGTAFQRRYLWESERIDGLKLILNGRRELPSVAEAGESGVGPQNLGWAALF
jgi:hypothetical protein